MTTLNWIHLSDLHFKLSTAFENHNRKKVLDALWVDIRKQIEQKGLQPDLVFFTGDVADKGASNEYDLAIEHFFQPLLSTTKVSREKLFIVPGNHDVDRQKIKYSHNQILRGCLGSRDKINQFLSADEECARKLCFEKFLGYQYFVNELYDGTFTFDENNYCFSHQIKYGNFTIGIAGLNTAWMSGVIKDDEGKVSDKGNLFLGEMHLDRVLQATADCDLRIALLHHPKDFFDDRTERLTWQQLRSESQIVLSGHLHSPSINIERSFGDSTINIPSGTVYQNRDYLNGYNLVSLDLRTGDSAVYFRVYDSKHNQWVKDVFTTGEDLDGKCEFSVNLDDQPKKCTVSKRKREKSQNTRTIPVVVVAMTRDEASELVNSSEFRQAKKYFPDLQKLVENYGENSRDSWCPFNSKKTIKKIFEEFSEATSENGSKFKARFELHSDKFFSRDQETRNYVIKNLKERGCLFVIDGLSLFLAKLRESYVGNIPDRDKSISYITSPINVRENPLNELIYKHMGSLFDRFIYEHDKDLDLGKGLFIGNEIDLARLLNASLERVRVNIEAWEVFYSDISIEQSGFGKRILKG